jgi:hypothetical protein
VLVACRSDAPSRTERAAETRRQYSAMDEMHAAARPGSGQDEEPAAARPDVAGAEQLDPSARQPDKLAVSADGNGSQLGGYATRSKAVPRATALIGAVDASTRKKPRIEALDEFETLEAQNARVLLQDGNGTWHNGVRRFRVNGEGAADLLSWVVMNTSRTLSSVSTEALLLDGFQDYDAVHGGSFSAARQLQHTFVISRTQRRRALDIIPGLSSLVTASQAEIESMHLNDTPERLEWLTGHILNQGDVHARFQYHQDTTEERKAIGGRRDRQVIYTAIVKLNRGGCTSMIVCGQQEVFYHAQVGSGVIFRSDLHHRTEKAEPGIWKIALFFGRFL